MKKTVNYLLFFLAIFLIACDRNDENFRMKTEESYFLVQENNGERHISSFTDNKVNPNWQLGDISKVGDICGENNTIWVSDINGKRVARNTYLKNGENAPFYSTENVIPHLLCVGEKYLLVGDSVNHKLLFMNKKNGKIAAIKTLNKKPNYLLFKFAKFYIVEENDIEIYDEQAIALRNTLSFRHKVTHLQASPIGIHANSFGNDTLFESYINIFEDGIKNNLRKTYQEIAYSPYNRVVFGTETEGSCVLSKGKLSLNSVPIFTQSDSINQVEIDFFQSNFFFQSNGNLYQQNINDSIPSLSIPFTGKILKAVYRQDYISYQ